MRAKLRIAKVERVQDSDILTFYGVSKSAAYPDTGYDEDNTYAKFSPSADLKIQIANPELIGVYAPGDTFYVDFTPVKAA